ncbi:MAG: DUF4198 domain-containing protein [Acinetobacter sp.]|nr:MAG: DUF4198 domain-containing protein [Acinetobacter sp.]
MRQSNQPVTLTITLDGKVQPNFDVVASKEVVAIAEKELEIKAKTDAKGQVHVTFPQAGQYMLEVDTPASGDKVQPTTESYRVRIAVQVN